MNEPIQSVAWWSSVLVGSFIGACVWALAAIATVVGWYRLLGGSRRDRE